MASDKDSKLQTLAFLVQSLAAVALLQIAYGACKEAYIIRMYAVKEYGRVIHEFDPYFNYRATEYLWQHGWTAFCQWFDYLVWYPLGRPVGTTIYPGMQVTSVMIKKYILPEWSINDICVFVPAWFGVAASVCVGWMTYECTAGSSPEVSSTEFGSILNEIPVISTIYKWTLRPAATAGLNLLQKVTASDWGLTLRPAHRLTPLACGVAATAVMSVLPAHLSRSVAGGYDNESIAMTAMVLTYCCWTRALRFGQTERHAILWGIATGLAYFYMVAAWGGYVFVLNMVGVHAAMLVGMGRYSTKLHRAYTAFFIVGTTLAIQVPVVGWTPLKSIEQMGPLLVFGGMQLLEYVEIMRRRAAGKGKPMGFIESWTLRFKVFFVAGCLAAICVILLYPTGYFGPITSRVRGLFVKHTKTGNPLVDSVAEHQQAPPDVYLQYLQQTVYIIPFGFLMTVLMMFNDSSSFLLAYGLAASFFSHRMVRLILLTAPIAAAFTGIVLGRVFMWMVGGLLPEEEAPPVETVSATSTKKKGKKANAKPVVKRKDSKIVRVVRLAMSASICFQFLPYAKLFANLSHDIAIHISHPTIIYKAQTRGGKTITVDDYRDAYLWLKDNTPEDARIMAWWDYGYQIAGIANRTTIADGNTWNHEHIALLGYILTSPEKEAHRIARHMADYVLVWAGGNGDDFNKSPHLRRIANSVYRNICSDPTCRDFNIYSDGSPTPLMAESLVYKLVVNEMQEGVEIDKNRFREVYSSKYGKVRIYKIQSVSKESKDWVADPANKICDAEGSWYCRGQYPPALQKVLKGKKDFAQLEDFNAKDKEDDTDSEYQKEYFENLGQAGRARKPPSEQQRQQQQPRKQLAVLAPEEIDAINERWEDNDITSTVWKLINENQYKELLQVLLENPEVAHVRSSDGRGPLFWAYENKRSEIIHALKSMGVSESRKDAKGIAPPDLFLNGF